MKTSCKRFSVRSFQLFFIMFLVLSFCFICQPGSAETIVVTNTSDDVSVKGCLRYAIESADIGDIIDFELDYPATITLSRELVISKDITIQGPGAEDLFISGNNTCRVFYIDPSAMDITVTITDLSIVSGDAGTDLGGGILNKSDNLTLTNCTFSGNNAYRGGGMNNRYSSPTISNCTFSGNTSEYVQGVWDYGGGGMCNDTSSPTVTNCTFIGNTAALYGGGMMNGNNSRPTLYNCTFSGNRSDANGGGMHNFASSPTISNCTFIGNNAISLSGGMDNYGSSPTLYGCTFIGNTASSAGGVFNRENSCPTLYNCTFHFNSAGSGGAMRNSDSSNPILYNCTFSDNIANKHGSGIYNDASSPSLTNCIFWDEGDEIYNVTVSWVDPSTPIVNYCIVRSDDVGIGTISSDITSADPFLEPLADNGGPTWTCALGEGSPAIDGGITITEVSTDQRGAPRPQGASFDIGAYESGVGFYEITATWSNGGSISPDHAIALAGIEDEVFTLLPDEGYVIEAVYVDDAVVSYDESSNTITLFDVSASHDIYASFMLDEQDDGEGGGGCCISTIPVVGLLLMIPMLFLAGKIR